MSFKQVVEYFRSEMPWQLHVDGVERLGSQLNEPSERFMKSRVIEKSLCVYNKIPDDLVWVNQKGRDTYIKSIDEFVEIKFQNNLMYTKKGNRKKIVGKDIKLLNSNGTNKRTGLPIDYADNILLLEARGAALLKKPGPEMLKFNGDSITLTGVRWDEVEVIFGHKDFCPSVLIDELAEEEKNFMRGGMDALIEDFARIVMKNSK